MFAKHQKVLKLKVRLHLFFHFKIQNQNSQIFETKTSKKNYYQEFFYWYNHVLNTKTKFQLQMASESNVFNFLLTK